MDEAQCPVCQMSCWGNLDVRCVDVVDPKDDPERKARIDLVLECSDCRSQWNAFVALADFYCNRIGGEPL